MKYIYEFDELKSTAVLSGSSALYKTTFDIHRVCISIQNITSIYRRVLLILHVLYNVELNGM